MPPWGHGPEQEPIYDGPDYITKNFPKLDKFITCTVERRRVMPEEEDTDREEVKNQEEEEEATLKEKKKKHLTPEEAKAILEQMEQDKRELDAAAQGQRIILNKNKDGNEQHQKASIQGDETTAAGSAMTTSTMGVGAVLALFVLMMMVIMIMFQRNCKKPKVAGKAN
jgi:predicted RND superfamily exporter protein